MVGAQWFWALDGLEFGFCSFLVYLVYGGVGVWVLFWFVAWSAFLGLFLADFGFGLWGIQVSWICAWSGCCGTRLVFAACEFV